MRRLRFLKEYVEAFRGVDIEELVIIDVYEFGITRRTAQDDIRSLFLMGEIDLPTEGIKER